MDIAEESDQRNTFRGRVQVASLAQDVAFGEKAFDDLGSGGGCAESAFAHGLTEIFVFDQFSGTFHGGEEGCFVVARGRAGFEGTDFDGIGKNAFALRDGAKVGIGLLFSFGTLGLGLLAVDLHPAGVDDDFAVGFEGVAFNASDPGGDLELCGREEDRDETL